MNLDLQISTCAACRICIGAAHQSPPVLYFGSLNASIVVIAQNPGEIADKDKFRLAMGKEMSKYTEVNGTGIDPQVILGWYSADFTNSPGYLRMSKVFGDNWVHNGKILYTNAVRCRTPKNATPSNQMIETCYTWTRIVSYRPQVKAIIFIGKISTTQFLGEKVDRLKVGMIKKHPDSGKLLLQLPHYVLWADEDLEQFRATYLRLAKAVGDKE